jgi:RNA polymerase sigma-70 factor (ECF subfamily)
MSQGDEAPEDEKSAPTKVSPQEMEALLSPYLRRHILDVDDTRDLFQEVYARYLRSPRVEVVRNPAAYVLRIARSVVMDYMRHRRTRAQVEVTGLEPARLGDTHDERTDVSSEVEEQQAHAQIEAAIARLPAVKRAVLALSIRGMTIAEIAVHVGVSKSKVERDLASARREIMNEIVGQRRDFL